MFDKLICFLSGHKWHNYPKSSLLPDYKVCDRCSKSIALSPYLTAGEVEYIDRMFVDALSMRLLATTGLLIDEVVTDDPFSEFVHKDEKTE